MNELLPLEILVAEDFEPTRILLEGLILEWGYRVIAVGDGEQAWQVLGGPNPPRLVVSDWLMPGLDGLALCRRIKSDPSLPFIYTILVTNRDGDGDEVAALDAGGDDFVSKPIVAEVLRSRIDVGRRLLLAQQKLATQHSIMTTLLESMPDAVCMQDREGRVIKANRAAHCLFQLDSDYEADSSQNLLQAFLRCEHLEELNKPDGRVFEVLKTPLENEQGTLAVARDVTLRKNLEDQRIAAFQESSAERIRDLVALLVEAQEDEREKLAWEIHDGLLQSLCGANMLIQLVKDRLSYGDQGRDQLQLALESLDSINAEGRRLMWGLRPGVLDEHGLQRAVELEVDRLSQTTGWKVSLEYELSPVKLPPALETSLYRMAQEALSNARKHSGGSEVMIRLSDKEAGIQLRVEDQGCGFSLDHDNRSGLGLTTLSQRAEMFGGWCNIESAIGEGTTVVAWLPL